MIHRETGDSGPLDGTRAHRRSGAGVLRDFRDARRHLLGRSGDGLEVAGHLLRRRRHHTRLR